MSGDEEETRIRPREGTRGSAATRREPGGNSSRAPATGSGVPAAGSGAAGTPTPVRGGFLRRVFDNLRSAARAPEEISRLGRYRLLHRLGQGGMGVVFAAEDETLSRRVAVKVIAEPDDSARRRFRREARAAAGVNHPNVCQVYEIGEDGGRLFIAMELLEGEPLQERLARGPLPLTEAQALARGLLAALAALHESGIVHRDLKPSNVFLTRHGVKLLDFGLARPLPLDTGRLADSRADITRAGLIVGSPRYMAPEQVIGETVDERTDIFAAGAILYEAIAGRPAFQGDNVVQLLAATLHEQPPPLSGGAAVRAFDRVVRRALAKRPSERPASAAEMAALIETIRPGEPDAGAATAQPLRRLVVLPFRLLRPDPDTDFLGFALAEAVSASLCGLPSLVVRSSSVAARFAAEAPDLPAIATSAEVDLVLMGSILRGDSQLRVSTQLVEAPAGTIVSSQSLHAPVSDVFQLQDELATRIVEALSPSLAGRGSAASRRGTPASARAYEFYLRANEVVRDWSQAAIARDLYRQCVEEDPKFAPGWARLGRAHRLLAKYHLEAPEHNLALSGEAFRRALELDPELPIAHKLVAHHEAERGDARGALKRLLGLARRTTNDPEIWSGLVHACRYCGLLEASLAAHREARRLDPHIWTSVIFTWWALGDFEAILREATDAADPELRVMALHALGRSGEARELARRLQDGPGPPVVLLMLRNLLAVLDGTRAASEAVAQIVSAHTDPEALSMYGCWQAMLHDHDRALATLRRSVDGGFTVPRMLREQRWLGPLQGLPQMATLVATAERARASAEEVFEQNGGPALLGLPAPP